MIRHPKHATICTFNIPADDIYYQVCSLCNRGDFHLRNLLYIECLLSSASHELVYMDPCGLSKDDECDGPEEDGRDYKNVGDDENGVITSRSSSSYICLGLLQTRQALC
ncbi:hypothetical protein LX36DRAFT_333899 [Colletotrichum falcatum]|nr:hypothetical protein LX36DRAFT_333899 [Colletotrichum falcatum]